MLAMNIRMMPPRLMNAILEGKMGKNAKVYLEVLFVKMIGKGVLPAMAQEALWTSRVIGAIVQAGSLFADIRTAASIGGSEPCNL